MQHRNPVKNYAFSFAACRRSAQYHGLLRFVQFFVFVWASTSGSGSTRGRTAPAIFPESPADFSK